MCHYITLTELFSVQAYSLFKYIPRGIVVTFDDFSAVWAYPHSIGQLQICILLSAVVACLRRSEELASLDAGLVVKHALVVNLLIDFSESSVLHCTRNLMIAHHAGDISVFSEDDVVSHDEVRRHLLCVVLAHIRHPLAVLGERKACLLTILAGIRRMLRYLIRLHVLVYTRAFFFIV